MSFNDLYQEMILDHSKHPRNFGALLHATHEHLGYNPLCGDKIKVYISLVNGVIENLSFEGTGCAISMASASLLTESLKGKTLREFETVFNGFHSMVMSGTVNDELGKLSVLSGVSAYPMRVKCATLVWHTTRAALENDPSVTKTE